MTAPGGTAALSPSGNATERTHHRRWRLIPEIDRDPKIIAYAQRVPGRILLFLCFTLVFLAIGADILIVPCAAAAAYAGRYRWQAVALGTLLVLYHSGFLVDSHLISIVISQEGLAAERLQPGLTAGMIILVILLCAAALHCREWIYASPPLQRPTPVLIVGFLSLACFAQALAGTGLPRVLIWSFLTTFLPYFWFLIYGLTDVAREHAPVWRRLGVFQPFWGSTLTPFGKGYAYLQRFEATTPEALAVTQLKGLKLAIWVGLLYVCLHGLEKLVYGEFKVPEFDTAFGAFNLGNPYPRWLCWVSLIIYFFEDLLNLSVWGGAIIAGARMAGFRLLRNTYRPLEAKTLAEFWNRYFFYFKELMMDRFFFPTFLSCFKRHRQLRIFFATFTAACFGNLVFHFIRDIHFVAELGLRQAVIGEQSHALYTILLALGVGISQMRRHVQPHSNGWLRDALLPRVWIVLFYCILHVFDAPLDRVHTLSQRAAFLVHLLWIDKWI